MKFKGNFGELTLNINGTEATGTYQENGTLKGEFINNTFKGQWENKDLEGLVEFTITNDKLEGNWKKGLEPGPMKGKWEGSLIENKQTAENKSESFDQNDDNPIKDYLIKNSGKDFTLYMYTRFVKDYLGKLDLIDNDDTQKKLERINNDLIELYNSNPDLYGGAVYIFRRLLKMFLMIIYALILIMKKFKSMDIHSIDFKRKVLQLNWYVMIIPKKSSKTCF